MPRSPLVESKRWSVAYWAEQVSSAWSRSVKDIVETGRVLLKAEDALSPSGFTELIGSPGKKGKLGVGYETARKLMRIGGDKRIRRILAHGPKFMLPSHWRTLYELTLLSDEQFEHAVKAGLITADMQRSDVEKLRKAAEPSGQDIGHFIRQTREPTPVVPGSVPFAVPREPTIVRFGAETKAEPEVEAQPEISRSDVEKLRTAAPPESVTDSGAKYRFVITRGPTVRYGAETKAEEPEVETEPEISREDIGRFARKLIQLDLDLARELYRLLRADGDIAQFKEDLMTEIERAHTLENAPVAAPVC